MCYPLVHLPINDSILQAASRDALRREAATMNHLESGGDGDGGDNIDGGGVRTCVCSPTQHPGSFRCRNHRAEYQWPGFTRIRNGHGRGKKGKSMFIVENR
ncbi:hypothetical protein RND81_09G118300 [Saponaria officinalis]|uniref:Uncharacterized protein n=1 Tax=Saponaria officinalis TaxID=3572 RepID=A0AAW1ILP8_SAPOF